MKRIILMALAAAFLALPCHADDSGGWTSNAPVTQHFGPKYGDYLKNKGATQQPVKPKPKQDKKKKQS